MACQWRILLLIALNTLPFVHFIYLEYCWVELLVLPSTCLGQGNLLQNIHYFGYLHWSPQRPVVLRGLLHCLHTKVFSKFQLGATWHSAESARHVQTECSCSAADAWSTSWHLSQAEKKVFWLHKTKKLMGQESFKSTVLWEISARDFITDSGRYSAPMKVRGCFSREHLKESCRRRTVGWGKGWCWLSELIPAPFCWAPICRWQMAVAEAIKIHAEQKKEQISHFVYRFLATGYSPSLLTGHGVWIIPAGNKTTCSFSVGWNCQAFLHTAEDAVLCPFTREEGDDEQPKVAP